MHLLPRSLFQAAAVLTVSLLVAGCDLSDDVDLEKDLPRLVGAWRVTDIVVDSASIRAQLNAQYEQLALTLRESGGGSNFFTIIGQADDSKADLFVQGRFSIDSQDDEISLIPDNNPISRFEYLFLGSEKIRLVADPGDEEDFLDTVRIFVQGTVDDLHVDLER